MIAQSVIIFQRFTHECAGLCLSLVSGEDVLDNLTRSTGFCHVPICLRGFVLNTFVMELELELESDAYGSNCVMVLVEDVLRVCFGLWFLTFL